MSSGASSDLGPRVGSPAEREERASQPGELLVGDLVGRYVVLASVGASAGHAVYAAFDPDLGRRVSLAFLADGGAAERVPDKTSGAPAPAARGHPLARLDHPNIVAVHDLGVFRDRRFVAMEFVEGEPLEAWLRAAPRTPAQVLDCFLQAGRGLAAAHRQRIVHGRFTAQSVLVGRDGRTRVADFGLTDGARTRTLGPDEPGLAGPLADQHDFCVCLVAALGAVTAAAPGGADTRRRPWMRFDSQGLTRRQRRALRRGLEADPEVRPQSMDSLLAELGRPPLMTVAGAGALLLVALTSVGLTYQWARTQQSPQALCAAAAQVFDRAWDDAVRARVETAFLGTRRPFAQPAFQATARRLDAIRAAWVSAQEDNCRATHVLRVQSERDLDLRRACLLRRLDEVRAATRLLEQADAEIVEKSVGMLDAVRGLEVCADVAALAGGEVLPEAPSARERIEVARASLVEAAALANGGKYQASLRLVEAAQLEARRLPYFTLRALSAHQLGLVYAELRRPVEAEGAFREAVFAAEQARQDRLRALPLVQLIRVVGYDQRHHAEAEAWSALAGSAAAGLGDERLRAVLLAHEGSLLQSEGRGKEAQARHLSAIEILTRLGDEETPELAGHHEALASIAIVQGDYPEARSQLDRAGVLLEHLYGAQHPRVAVSRSYLGRLFLFQGRVDDAIRTLSEVVELLTASTGGDSALLASPLLNLGSGFNRRGDYERAKAAIVRGIDLTTKYLPPGSMQECVAQYTLGEIAAAQERWEEAERHHLRSLRLSVEATGTDSLEAVSSYDALGRVYAGLGLHEKSLAQHRLAFEVCRKNDAVDGAAVLDSLVGQAEALVALRRGREALPAIERAIAVAAKDASDQSFLAYLSFVRALALRTEGAPPARVRELVRGARRVIAGDPAQRVLLRRIDAFLSSTGRTEGPLPPRPSD